MQQNKMAMIWAENDPSQLQPQSLWLASN